MTETFLEDIDTTWEEYGFNSRSEFIRAVLRDALKHPEFNRADLKAMLTGEHEIREVGGGGSTLTNRFVVDGKVPGVEQFFKRNLDDELDRLQRKLEDAGKTERD